MKKLRIATMVTAHFTTPPPKGMIYAPMDVAVNICQGLKKRGHKVTFFAPEGSKIKGVNLKTLKLKPLKQSEKWIEKIKGQGADIAKLENLWDQYLLSHMFKGAIKGEYDILHIHPIDRALSFALAWQKIPVIYTMHDPLNRWRINIYRMFQSKNQHFVSISNAQRKPAPDLNYAATIYNGIDLDKFPFADKPKDYFVFVSNLREKKGAVEAVAAARGAKVKLLIIGPESSLTKSYWKKEIAPYLNNKIRYIGFVKRERLYKYYQNAKAVLVPIKWEEPFGLVMTEAMACGCPVIAFRRGSVPEIVEHKKTGFIVKPFEKNKRPNIKGLVEAMKKIEQIKRINCRKRVEKKFSTDSMAKAYEKLFLKIARKYA